MSGAESGMRVGHRLLRDRVCESASQRRGLLDEQAFERDGGEHAGDGLRPRFRRRKDLPCRAGESRNSGLKSPL